MTAEPDLLPSSVAAFTEALHGERGSLDAWLEVNDEREVAAHIEAYARACVAHAVAPLQDEIEALRAEVEKLRALAGCAYQMAGMHDAPLVWLDRLSEAANGDALPDVDTLMDELLPYQPDVVCEAEARADKLRAEVATWEGLHASEVQVRQRWQARAERLAEALRDAADDIDAGVPPEDAAAHLRARADLLRDQEEGNG